MELLTGHSFGWKQAAMVIAVPALGGLVTYILSRREMAHSGNQNADFIKIEIPVSADKIGAVIGKNGSVIREIERTTGARICVKAPPKAPITDQSDDEKDGVIIIQGLPIHVEIADITVRKVIATTPPVMIEHARIPKSSIGLIIGKGGVNIKELYSLSGAKVIVGQTGNDNETVTIKGRPAAIDIAKIWLEKKVNESEELNAKRKRASSSTSKRSVGVR